MKQLLKALAKKGVRWLLVHAEDELMKEIQRHDLNKIANELADKLARKL